MNDLFFPKKVISWYHQHKRELPWRNTHDAYKIWLSEVILQQTRVKQGLPYYEQFISKYPNIFDLANAEEQDVLRTWQGLGYYSRARNLHKCAKIICTNYGGKFPNTYKSILKLPGIGPYTAAAIASFAFGEKVAVVDGNVYRVLSRIFGIKDDIATGPGQKAFALKAQQLISEDDPDIYNQGIMEFGAIHCTPKQPGCMTCIFHLECEARRKGIQDKLPVKSKKLKVRKRYFNYICIRYNDKLLLRQRKKKDIWQGLYDFYLVETKQKVEIDDLIATDGLVMELVREKAMMELSEEYVHILSHQRIYTRFLTFRVNESEGYINSSDLKDHQFYDLNDVIDLPKPVLISRYLNDTFF
ncbi:A/G-specific adenine glycosylase [Fulvivirga sp. M361]|uniref:A/G-specific adenine glycosylase n=1 Tax=Fulvivirga sp. M361 TaxID=2594266 RepID=UPI00117B37BD|nr:A/G-specific adenine glycosylase [Fulvivirga sp. M361]TRX58394.1 A/G-specific adenine glycosylase [Fulvivirga sp. M361]